MGKTASRNGIAARGDETVVPGGRCVKNKRVHVFFLPHLVRVEIADVHARAMEQWICLLYTSDAADES